VSLGNDSSTEQGVVHFEEEEGRKIVLINNLKINVDCPDYG